jgi:selenocysteine lyase/cysteine desulfurase
VTFEQFRSLFPVVGRFIPLNHAGVSPASTAVSEAVQGVLEELMGLETVSVYAKLHPKRQAMLRAALGRMLRCEPSNLAFVRNTSHGLALAAQSLKFSIGDNIVVPATEYPSNVYPWMAQGERGVSTKLVPAQADGIIDSDDLIEACDERTRVMAVPFVHWGTGQRLNLPKLGAFCKERGIIFVVDGVQGVGALRLDLSELPIDIAVAGCHKWLLTPGGIGFLYVRPEIFREMIPTNIGWNSVENAIDWERLHFDELKPTPERFEEGTPALLATAAFLKSVELLESLGFDSVEGRVLTLARYARRQLTRKGYHVVSPDNPAQRSGIIAFRHPRLTNDEVLSALEAKKVISAIRCGNVRFAPHCYNNEEDIDRAIAALPAL